ncbi:PREDICTED: cytochrome P450 27C1-like [Acropora digitifera]|uniref:cytochrome P450 27C1-like n=1 Tax=Acropora digitifera TaxID=70779 RepID=UPI00077A78C7|nr:PREDICTED: cytochrome P450 27C1-like [Acropora digitifera]
MLSAKICAIVVGRNPLRITQNFKSLGSLCLWRSKSSQAASREASLDLVDSTEIEDHGEVRPFEDIPGPKRSLRNLIAVYRRSEGLTKNFKVVEAFFKEYGPIFKQDLTGDMLMVHILDPDDYKKVFRAEGKYPQRPLLDFWVEHRKRRNYFPGLVLLQGEEWQRVRKSIAPKMMRLKTVQENIDNFHAVTGDAITRIIKLKEACGGDGHIPNLEEELKKFSMESIGTVAFNTRLGLYQDPPPEKALKFIEAVDTFFIQTQKMLNLPSAMMRQYIDTPALKKFFKAADDIVDIGEYFISNKMKELKEMTEKGIEVSDEVVPVLTYLLTTQNLSLEEVNGLAIDVISAGVDTLGCPQQGSHIPAFLVNGIVIIPSLINGGSVGTVLRAPMWPGGFRVVPNNLVVRKYLLFYPDTKCRILIIMSLFCFSPRLSSVLPGNARVLDQDIVLSGYRIPAKTFIAMELYCTAHSEKYFKDAMEFKPERWLRENRDEYHAFANLPFGYGVRMCLGRRVAELEIYLFLCKLLQRFRIEYVGEELEPIQKLLSVPEKPVKVKLVDRF